MPLDNGVYATCLANPVLVSSYGTVKFFAMIKVTGMNSSAALLKSGTAIISGDLVFVFFKVTGVKLQNS